MGGYFLLFVMGNMYFLHCFDYRNDACACCDNLTNNVKYHHEYHSLPGVGFAAYRSPVYSLFIIAYFSTFVNIFFGWRFLYFLTCQNPLPHGERIFHAQKQVTIFNSRPRNRRLLVALRTVPQIQIDQRLIGYPGLRRKLLEKIDRAAVDIDRDLFFQPVGIGVLAWVQALDVIFISHGAHHPSS